MNDKVKMQVSYDLITKYDGVSHLSETINAKSAKSALTYLRIKNKKLGFVRNFSSKVLESA